MPEERRYTSDQVSDIVHRALSMKQGRGDVSHEELIEIAAQSGLSEDEVTRAIAEEEYAIVTREKEGRRWARRQHRFHAHLRTYLIVNGALLLIDLWTGEGMWFFWPALVWGMGLALHASNTFFPRP